MRATFSKTGLQLCLSANRCSKYLTYVEWFVQKNRVTRHQASELGGRLAWSCNALFGRCGRASLVPILRHAANRAAHLRLNNRRRGALKWWHH